MDEHIDQSGLTGLQNLGNTCYMNAALQGLSNCPPLTIYFQTCSQAVACRLVDRGRQSIARCYSQLIEDLWQQSSTRRTAVIDPSQLYSQFRSAYPSFQPLSQQDAQEFLRCFLDRLHEELSEPAVRFLASDKDATVVSSSAADSGLPNGYNEATTNMTNSQFSESSGSDYCIPQSQSFGKYTDSPNEESYETAEEDETSAVDCSPPDDDLYMLNGNYSSGVQPDLTPCHESRIPTSPPHLFRRLLTDSDAESNACHGQQLRSIISDLFDGQIRSSVKCLTCGNISSTRERFQDLSLPIPSYQDLLALRKAQTSGDTVSAKLVNSPSSQYFAWVSWIKSWLLGWNTSSGTTPTLSDCLSAFFVADELKGDDMYSCSHCAKLRNGIRYAELLEPLPEVLCIHLKRFRHDLNNGVSKIKQHVSFPISGLDLQPYIVSGSLVSSRRSSTCSPPQKTDSELSSQADSSENCETLYDLAAIVQHDGSPSAGHYTAVCRHEMTGQWYEYDDECCTQVSLDKVGRTQAYVLFYRRRPSPSSSIVLHRLATLCRYEAPALARLFSQSANNIDTSLLLTESASVTTLGASFDSDDDDLLTYATETEHENQEYCVHNHNRRRHRISKRYGNVIQRYASRNRKHKNKKNKKIRSSYSECNEFFCSESANSAPSPYLSSSLLVYYVSKQWLARLQSFSQPGPISNYDFLCEHGAVQPRLFPDVVELVHAVPGEAWCLLSKTYGGGPVCNKLDECPWCREEAEQIRSRQLKELERYNSLENESGISMRYAIDKNWFRRWRSFVTNQPLKGPWQAASLQTGSYDLLLPPGPIDNLSIASPTSPRGITSPGVFSGSPPSASTSPYASAESSPSQVNSVKNTRYELKAGCFDYVRVKEASWQFFVSVYGGGPELVALTNES